MVCPVCGRDAKREDSTYYCAMHIKCPHCGVFLIEQELFDVRIPKSDNSFIYDLSHKTRSCMYYYLTQLRHPNNNIIPHFHNNSSWGDKPVIESNNHQFISLKSLHNFYPKNIADQAIMSLLNLSHLSKYPGDKLRFDSNSLKNLYDMFFLKPLPSEADMKIQLNFFETFLKEANYIKQTNGVGDDIVYVVTANGWNKVAKLKESRSQNKQGFIAMWFDSSMKIAREKILSAIEYCGYTASIIDAKEHNNQIVPEIFYEIKNSKFIIADVTGQRGGVYYEAGYAEALNIPVILCCREDDFPNTHFDVKQKSAILWNDEEDLYKKLISRISATVGRT